MSLRARGLKTHRKERPRQHRVRLCRPLAQAGDTKERESSGNAGCGYAAPRLSQAKSDRRRTCPGTAGCGRAAPRLCQAKIEKKLPKKRGMECRNGRPRNVGKRQQVSSLPCAGHAAQDRSAVLPLQCHTQGLQELLHSKPHRKPSAGRNEGAQRSPGLHCRWPPAAPTGLNNQRDELKAGLAAETCSVLMCPLAHFIVKARSGSLDSRGAAEAARNRQVQRGRSM